MPAAENVMYRHTLAAKLVRGIQTEGISGASSVRSPLKIKTSFHLYLSDFPFGFLSNLPRDLANAMKATQTDALVFVSFT